MTELSWLCSKLVLKRIFGTKRQEVAGSWRRMHDEFITCMLHEALSG
jgi:hypothetical protein